MMNYMPLDDTVDILAEVARQAGLNSGAMHPEDVACAMINAIEGAQAALTLVVKKNSQ